MKTKKPFTQRFLTWFDQSALTYLAGFLILFIPLYPKIPLFDAIPGYIVRVRLEDLFILLTVGLWFIQFLRHKVKTHPLIGKLILIYAVIGLLSCLSALFITRTVPLVDIHLAKLFLHYFRRLQYLSLFYVFFSAVKSIKQVKIILLLFVLSLIGVAGYGFGQKYLYWPVYSTMNREFAKGWKLYLTEHARVPSTFGGHYDAAAFTLVAVTIALSLFFFTKNRYLKFGSGLAYIMGVWLIVLTASRTSSLGYVLAIIILTLLAALIRGFWWAIPRFSLTLALSVFVMLSFGDLNERFAQVLGVNQLKDKFGSLLFSQKAAKPEDFDSVSEIAKVTVSSDTPPTPVNPVESEVLPGDVYEKIPIPMPVLDAEGNPTGEYINVSRTYSDNAYKYGLSAAIRFDALWPRALQGFLINPLLGSGYSTLTKEEVGQFTEAESTDNEFLRTLGETGLLGFISFFGIIFAIFYLTLISLKNVTDPLIKGYALGFLAATVGLLLNATYIDVFTASKVAETYWSLAGLLMASLALSVKPAKSSLTHTHKKT